MTRERAAGRPGAAARSGARGGRRRLRAALLWVALLLFVLSIPWYRSSGGTARLVFGLPDWVAVALGCYLAVAVLNALAWLLTEIPEGVGARGEDETR